MKNYEFNDVSHHKGKLNFQSFADLGDRIGISKASDSYHMPDKDGKYDFKLDRHTDAYFVDNFVGFRSVGLISGHYHFGRVYIPNIPSILVAQRNLDNYIDALESLPDDIKLVNDIYAVGILDMEQSTAQLEYAGLSKQLVSNIVKDIFDAFAEVFNRMILYSGSWWTDQWLTEEVSWHIAERAAVWEPEYVYTGSGGYILSEDGHSPDPRVEEYMPTLPKGFRSEFLTDEGGDWEGGIFAHQYGLALIDGKRVDRNRTELSYNALAYIFGQDAAVDPPGDGSGDNLSDADKQSVQGAIDLAYTITDLLEPIIDEYEEPWEPWEPEEPTEPETPEEPEEPVDPPVVEPTYRWAILKRVSQGYAKAYALRLDSNGKYKDNLIDGDTIDRLARVKVLGFPTHTTAKREDGIEEYGWWLLADGNDIRKNYQLANHFEEIPSKYEKSDLVFVESLLNKGLRQVLVPIDNDLYRLVYEDTGELVSWEG